MDRATHYLRQQQNDGEDRGSVAVGFARHPEAMIMLTWMILVVAGLCVGRWFRYVHLCGGNDRCC